jgi:putative SOS response-associated peptidase YedK
MTLVCDSAQIRADYHRFVRVWGAVISIGEFFELYWLRQQGAKLKIPKAMDAGFYSPQTDDERKIKALIDAYDAEQISKTEQEIFAQKKRLADAERKLLTKTTKAATDSKRIATDKISKAMTKLHDLRRTELIDRDARIFPGGYAPVMIMENGKRVVKPMRYQCRLAGSSPEFDADYPGCYNARRDNLEKFWRKQFGVSHGIMVVNAFYENVSRHKMEGRELAPGEKEENVVLEFKPTPTQDMLVACLWSHWQGPGEPDLLSFAAITDEPPAEVAAAGHDRCIIPIQEKNIDAWLNPDRTRLADMHAILDDRARPYYEHRMAA